MSKVVRFIEAGAASMWAIFAPIHSVIFASGVLILVDLITGLASAIKRKEAITSAKLRNTLSKLLIYEVALMLAFVAEHYISDVLPFVKLVSAMISLVELKSIYENLDAVSGGELLKSVISKLGSTNES